APSSSKRATRRRSARTRAAPATGRSGSGTPSSSTSRGVTPTRSRRTRRSATWSRSSRSGWTSWLTAQDWHDPPRHGPRWTARAGIELHHALAQGDVGHALAGYAAVFFGLWWAWVNFTWFASAYDTDDVPYRLLTLLQMAGVLVFAAGIPAAFEHFDFTIAVVGYVIMRMALVTQWL